MNERANGIAEEMTKARANTLALFDIANESDLHKSPGFGFRPIIWHLAHIGVFEGYWLLQKMQGCASLNPLYDRIFDPINTPREASVNLPARKTMEDYLLRVRDDVFRYLERADFESGDPLLKDAFIFDLVLQHEYQHQETLAYLFQMLDPGKKRQPSSSPRKLLDSEITSDMILIPGGASISGALEGFFAYDNELPAHFERLSPFTIDRFPVTNQAFADFISDRGYERRELWSDEGWSWRDREDWRCPLYWSPDGEGWLVRSMFEESAMKPNHPVTGVSWFEAEAYAKFVGKRLPTEAEWEKAASWHPGTTSKSRFAWGDSKPDAGVCNFDFEKWSTSPVRAFPGGASPYGVLDMTGNIWEWTSDAFSGYDGFRAFPYPEYSQEWFDGDHRVLKGGSWATRGPLLRTSFRNFFRKQFRIAFSGIRCAADA